MTEQFGPGEPATDETEYTVRLVMTVNAGSPEEAVLNFVDELIEKGLRRWVYGIVDPETGEATGNYDGHGVDMTARIAEIRRQLDSDPVPASTETDVHIPAAVESDDELLALAENLNAGQQ